MKIGPFFPLAKLLPLCVLTLLGVSSAFVVLNHPRFAEFSAYWACTGFLPLMLYLGLCHWRARKLTTVERAVEREIIVAGLVVTAAERCARFWASCFAIVAWAAFLIALQVWAYQMFIWYREKTWTPVTLTSVTDIAPQLDNPLLQNVLVWLGDTNLGVVAIIVGLVVAAPLAAANHNANLIVRRRRKELANLKNRPISEYESPT